jgi:predicted RNA-binding Zn ribbon-like protein
VAGPATQPVARVTPHDGADAPGDLAVVEAFVNTRDNGPGGDALADAASLDAWLRARRLLAPDDPVPTAADLDRVVAVREALRALLAANHGDVAPPGEALELLTREADAAPLAVDLSAGDHAHLRPAGTGVDRALAVLFAIVFHAMHDGTWPRLKACRSETCREAFYDTSRNRSGRWCDMAVCGNRSKAASYRDRHG